MSERNVAPADVLLAEYLRKSYGPPPAQRGLSIS
jgi:hypothetical protein